MQKYPPLLYRYLDMINCKVLNLHVANLIEPVMLCTIMHMYYAANTRVDFIRTCIVSGNYISEYGCLISRLRSLVIGLMIHVVGHNYSTLLYSYMYMSMFSKM